MNRTIFILFAAVLLSACEKAPSVAQIESSGVKALRSQDADSIKFLEKWANRDIAVAQRELGYSYSINPERYADAVKWTKKAASAGDAEAQFHLAEAYYKNRLGLQQDYKLAWQWYEQAAKSNDKASFMLARMAKYGQGVPQDLASSVEWLKKSSEQGNAQAMFLLSNAYAAGEGVKTDPIQARKWLEEAAEGDYPVAIQALAMELETGSAHTEKDPTRAMHLMKEASDERLLQWNKYQ